jgi:hypothetical protein
VHHGVFADEIERRASMSGPSVPTRHALVWEQQTQVVQISIKLTEREAHDLYSELYRLQRDMPDAPDELPLTFSVWDALHRAGVDGTR